MQKPWRGAAYCLAPHDLLSLFSYRIQDHQPRGDTIYHGLDPSRLITNLINALIEVPVSQVTLAGVKLAYNCGGPQKWVHSTLTKGQRA